MTEYVLREVGRHQWLVFADRQSIALCASENEAVKAMIEHSALSGRSRPLDNWPEHDPAALNQRAGRREIARAGGSPAPVSRN